MKVDSMKQNAVIFGPFIGELGWELFRFSPHFIYPNSAQVPGTIGNKLYLAIPGDGVCWFTTTPNNYPLGYKTGNNSVYFCGACSQAV